MRALLAPYALLWRALAGAVSFLYRHRREPALWLGLLVVIEAATLALIWLVP